MASLPIFQDPNQNVMLLQHSWKAAITPALQNELIQGNLIKNVSLINGATVINHLLSRQMIGWMLVDINAPATVYRSQPLNTKTLTLTSNAVCTANIWVF